MGTKNRVKNGTVPINFRIPEEWEIQIKQFCELHNITVSEYARGLIKANLEGMPPGMLSLGGFQEGYQQARALAIRLAFDMIEQARDMVPATYEEALARYGSLGGPGRRAHVDDGG